ncbi:uncharacterized protein [Diadema setosum]|uniref:uncharacterized protein n=1 Tax=Diadema setosum TaxID=31175 RepID=UPI003B3BE5FE
MSESVSRTGSASRYTTGAPSTSTSKRTRKGLLGGDEFMAAAIGDTAWLRQSLKGGKNPALFDKNGLSAIHLAALHGRIECLRLLVEKYHVNVNLASSTGWRPLHLCINSRTGKRALECLRYLLDMGADPSVVNEDLMSPAHQAAIEGSVKCLEVLLQRGADISKVDSNDHLPLDYAKIWGHRKCARILASETWKREKESELVKVTELQQLKELKDVVDEMEREDQQAYRDIQVEQTFNEWLENKGLTTHKAQTAATSTKREPVALGVAANQLFQANSPRRVKAPASKDKTMTGKKGDSQSKRGQPNMQAKTETKKADGKGGAAVARVCKGKKKPPLEPIAKVKVPILEITGEPNRDKATLYTQPVPDLTQEVIDRILLEKLSPHERPLLFKCKNIIDAQHKRLYDSSTKPLEEVYAHISNDNSSSLFPGQQVKVSTASSKSSRSSDGDGFNNQRLADALKHIAKPYRFPQLHGQDYTYGFEVL